MRRVRAFLAVATLALAAFAASLAGPDGIKWDAPDGIKWDAPDGIKWNAPDGGRPGVDNAVAGIRRARSPMTAG